MDKQRMYSLMRQAISDYQMIEEGDKIAVGVSGGKDSLTLLYLMAGFRKFSDINFELSAITCNVGFEHMDFTEVQRFSEGLEVPLEILNTEIAKIVFELNQDERPCSLCAKLRKGAMYERLKEQGINKIAYAHNKDDVIETAFLSLLYEGRFYSFPPVTYLDRANLSVIRPMIYIPEQSVKNFACDQKLPVVTNTCPIDGSTKRAYAKDLVGRLNKEVSGSKERIFHAVLSADLPDWPKKQKRNRKR